MSTYRSLYQPLLLLAILFSFNSVICQSFIELDLDDPAVYDSLAAGKPLNLKVGDFLRIVASENPSTGFTWQLNAQKNVISDP